MGAGWVRGFWSASAIGRSLMGAVSGIGGAGSIGAGGQRPPRNRYNLAGVLTVVTKPIQVKVKTDRDAMAAIEAVQEDGVPREIERDGKIVAVVNPSRASLPEWKPSKEAIERTLSSAGSLKDFPEFADLAERIHKWREDAPPSGPVNP